MRHKQMGTSGLVIMIVVAVAIFFVILGFKTVPVVTEYLGVKKMIRQLAAEHPNSSAREIKEAFTRKLTIEYVSAVSQEDLVITKENGSVSIGVIYDKPVRLFGADDGNHADLTFHFVILEGKKALAGAKVAE